MNRNRKPADFAISLDDSSRHWLWVSLYWNWPDFKWSRRRGWTTWWVFVPIKYGKRPPRAERLIRMSEDKLARRWGEYGMGSGNVQECTQEQLRRWRRISVTQEQQQLQLSVWNLTLRLSFSVRPILSLFPKIQTPAREVRQVGQQKNTPSPQPQKKNQKKKATFQLDVAWLNTTSKITATAIPGHYVK
jgi:hypothetical protein